MTFIKKTKWLTLVLGILIIVISAIFQYLPQLISGHESVLLVLSIFSIVSSTVGGIVISRAFENDEKFMKELNPRLSAIIRKSSLNTAMINKITLSEPNSNLTIRLQDIIPHLSSVTTDLTHLTGGELASEIAELNDNLKALQKITLQISGGAQQTPDAQQKSRKEIDLLVNKISDLSDSLSPVYAKVAEIVKCPYCGCENGILIGQAPPASACPTCHKCEKKFHANRQHDGSILIKEFGRK